MAAGGLPVDMQVLRGAQIGEVLPAVARLRISVFREWPYLYDGHLDYESAYLAALGRSSEAVFVVARDRGQVVGASTGLPLVDAEAAFQQPFALHGPAPAEVFYFGESVLLEEYRGRGIGGRFFDLREGHARALGRFRYTAFCAVERSQDDPRRPAAYRGNESLWTRRGYRRSAQLSCRLEWPELGRPGELPHRLNFWLRELRTAC